MPFWSRFPYRLKEEPPLPPIVDTVLGTLLSTGPDIPLSQPSYRCEAFYNPDPLDPRFSSLLYPSHSGVPRAYVQSMELDTGGVYVKALLQAGVEAKYTKCVSYPLFGRGAASHYRGRAGRYAGAEHGFHYSTPETELAVKVRADLVEGLKWLLGRESTIQGA